MEKRGTEWNVVDCPICSEEFLKGLGFESTREGLIAAKKHDPNKASCQKCRRTRTGGCKW